MTAEPTTQTTEEIASRARYQLHSLERIVRSFRLELDAVEASGASNGKAGRNFPRRHAIPNGLSSIFEESLRIPRRQVQAYDAFAPGVYVGYGAENKAEVVVAAESEDRIIYPGLRLEVRHEVAPDWLTLECLLAPETLRRYTTLGYSVVASTAAAASHLPPFGVSFYVRSPAGEGPHAHRFLPSLPAPQEIRNVLSSEDYARLAAPEVSECKVLIHLPQASSFTFELFHFELFGLEV